METLINEAELNQKLLFGQLSAGGIRNKIKSLLHGKKCLMQTVNSVGSGVTAHRRETSATRQADMGDL